MRALLLCACALLAVRGGALAQLPPDAEWRTLGTEHFRVHFTPELEPLARRAAARAEAAYARLAAVFVQPPPGRIDLLVTPGADYANGYATPFPTNRIVVFAHPPADEPALAFSDDWLELVVLHELVHILHLDRSRGVWAPLRKVFGRSPILFPQIFSPGWVKEGLATFYESELTEAGRVRGSLHEMILRTAILEGEFFSLDRATGDPATWPGGTTRYAYGSMFFEHLARRHGTPSIAAFVDAIGGQWVPYRMDAAARRAFGTSFTSAYREWQDSLDVRYHAQADSLRALGLTPADTLTSGGFRAAYPRFDRSGRIAYAAAPPRERAATVLIQQDGTERRIARRNSLAPVSWLPGDTALLTSQLQFQDPYRIYADAYRVGLAGDETRLTEDARIWELDAHPDGKSAVGVADADGTNTLVMLDLGSGKLRALSERSLDVQWALPRWSPDGSRIAAARTGPGRFDIVVLDSTGRELRQLTDDRAIDNAPAWSPDGRYLLFHSDRSGIPNLYAYDFDTGEMFQVTNTLGGAFQPDISPDGGSIAFSLYAADGYHIARMPFDPSAWWPAREPLPRFGAGAGGRPPVAGTLDHPPARPYSPWPSLRPAGASVSLASGSALGGGAGLGIGGEDLLGRYEYGAGVLLYPRGSRFDADANLRYRGFGVPVLDIEAEQEWSVSAANARRITPAGDTVGDARLRRTRSASAALLFPRPRFRSYSWLRTGAELRDRYFEWQDTNGPADFDTPPEVAGWVSGGVSTLSGAPLSLGVQDGISLSGFIEGSRFTRALEERESATGYGRGIGRASAFRSIEAPGFARHVAALRLSAGAASGSGRPSFGVGGASDGTSALSGLDLLGGGLTFPVRGFTEAAQFGDRAFSASAEYRIPIALIERGIRVAPVFLDRIWGDLFVDAGAAWCATDCERRFEAAPLEPHPLISAGAELIVELNFGFGADLPLRFGLAAPLTPETGSGTPGHRPAPSAYLRLGRSF